MGLFLFHHAGLILYAALKAFLPLPSLEVVLIPMAVRYPSLALWMAVEGAIGTAIGGAIGYGIAYSASKRILPHFCSEEEIASAKELLDRYGLWAVFIGGVTPIPDFLLAYLAGGAQMSFFGFITMDGTARFLRSLLVLWCIHSLGYVIDIERWGTVLSLISAAWLLIRWGKNQAAACS